MSKGSVKLTEKQRRFVEAYMGKARGNGTEAARIAGYKGTKGTLAVVANENLNKPNIKAAIEERIESDPLVLSREELQQWWSKVTRDKETAMKDRLRASELLGKSRAEFTDRVESEQLVVDVSSLTDAQLQRLRDGEDLMAVMGSDGS